uniref:Uncharacterized protein n=1 Tax=Arundo donax TaxID=35708 RepID=A0A0A9BU82_ARUDO
MPCVEMPLMFNISHPYAPKQNNV